MTLSRLELGFESPWGRHKQVRYCRTQCRIFFICLFYQATAVPSSSIDSRQIAVFWMVLLMGSH